MLNQIELMFRDMNGMMKKLKRPVYEKNMEAFRQMYGHYFEEMTAYVDAAEEKGQAADRIADVLVGKVFESHAVRGKVKGRTTADLNMFMVFYVFPALLLTGHDQAKGIADAICRKWAETFKNSNISYTDYDSLCGGFRTKIFGIF